MKESEMIQQIQNGNQEAFRELYDLYFDYAIRVASVTMKNTSAAADAVQECFIRVYQNIHLYQGDRPFKPWFYKILLNECHRILKRNSKVISVGDIVEKNSSAAADQHRFVEYEDLYAAICELEDHKRIPIVLRYLNGFSERDISEILELNVNTVKSRLFKGRQKLKEYLEAIKEVK